MKTRSLKIRTCTLTKSLDKYHLGGFDSHKWKKNGRDSYLSSGITKSFIFYSCQNISKTSCAKFKRHVNVVTLRINNELQDASAKNKEYKESDKTQTPCEDVEEDKEKSYVSPTPYKPHIPFSHCWHLKKVVHMCQKKVVYLCEKKLYIHIPFKKDIFSNFIVSNFFKKFYKVHILKKIKQTSSLISLYLFLVESLPSIYFVIF